MWIIRFNEHKHIQCIWNIQQTFFKDKIVEDLNGHMLINIHEVAEEEDSSFQKISK